MSTDKNRVIEPIKIALIAVGGDGGGVLTQWIVKLAEKNGYWAQSTTIAGVAQRTGSTVYYIELFPLEYLPTKNGKSVSPILAQMPAPEEVDIVMTTELIEAGRAIQRGFVSKKTTLIFSTHRNLAINEKETPGDGILDSKSIFELSKKYAKQSIYGNLKAIADKNGSVISATLFGALAASKTLPFPLEKFEETISEGGIAVATSLKAFKAAYGIISLTNSAPPKDFISDLAPASFTTIPNQVQSKKLQILIQEIKNNFPVQVQDTLYAGVLHLIEWQDEKWAKVYLDKLTQILLIDTKYPENQNELTQNVARYLALAMAYDDLVNVADVKTRSERWASVYKQVGAKEGEIVKTVDYFHPRFEEFFGFMPTKIGKYIEKSTRIKHFFEKYLDKDRRMSTHKLFWFTTLYFVGGLKGYRMKTLRHAEEMETIENWLARIKEIASTNYTLAVAIAKSYRLKKGYGDTYARGHSKFKAINDFAMKHKNQPEIHTLTNELIQFGLKNVEQSDLDKKMNSISLKS